MPTITTSMSMTFAMYMPMFTLAVVTLAVRTFHNTGSAYPMARVTIPMPMSIPITQDRWEGDTHHHQDCQEENTSAHDAGVTRLVWSVLTCVIYHVLIFCTCSDYLHASQGVEQRNTGPSVKSDLTQWETKLTSHTQGWHFLVSVIEPNLALSSQSFLYQSQENVQFSKSQHSLSTASNQPKLKFSLIRIWVCTPTTKMITGSVNYHNLRQLWKTILDNHEILNHLTFYKKNLPFNLVP